MGNPLFGVDIAGLINQHVGAGVLVVQISKQVATGARDPDNLAAGIPSEPVVHNCKGFWESYSIAEVDGVNVLKTDKKANLIGDSIPAGGMPVYGDEITIAGETRFVVQLDSVDPANALYVFRCRDQQAHNGQ